MARRLALFLPLLVVLGGCASWRRQGLSVNPPAKLRVAVLPLILDFKVKKLADLETVSSSSTLSAAQQRAQAESLQAALEGSLADAFEVRLSSSYLFSPIPRQDVEKAMLALDISTSTDLSQKQYALLARKLGADAVLRVKVHGYGRIRESWLFLLWASSFGEGAAQGVIVAEAAANVWAAVGVASEEVLQEGVEWFGGGYLFDRFYAPVILEGDFYSGKTGKNLWGRWFVVTENKKAVKKLPRAQQKRKEVRLYLTFQKARDAMIKGLEKAALKNEG